MSDALDLTNVSKRDKALVTILERMVRQLQIQDSLIKDLIARQDKISGSINDSVFHANLTRDEMDDGLKKLHDSFNRYRSDMLGFVHEQDLIRSSMDATLENVKKIAYSVERTGFTVLKTEAELEKQNNTLQENISYTNKQWDKLPAEFFSTNRKINELHANIDNYFAHLHNELEKHFKKTQSETTRRLLVLDDVMNALDILLIRTAPPEKKPFIFIRIFKIAGRFCKKIVTQHIGKFFTQTLPNVFRRSSREDSD